MDEDTELGEGKLLTHDGSLGSHLPILRAHAQGHWTLGGNRSQTKGTDQPARAWERGAGFPARAPKLVGRIYASYFLIHSVMPQGRWGN